MRFLSQKRKNNSGASMLLALVVFLLAAFAGIAVLTMAAANAGRYTHQRADQQTYLTVSSAVKFVQAELENFKATPSFVYNSEAETKLAGEINCEGSVLFAAMKTSLLAQCQRFLKSGLPDECFDVANPKPALDSITTSFTLDANSLANKDVADKIGKISVDLTIDEALTMTFTFKTDNAGYASEMVVKLLTTGDNYDVDNSSPDGSIRYFRELIWDAVGAEISLANA